MKTPAVFADSFIDHAPLAAESVLWEQLTLDFAKPVVSEPKLAAWAASAAPNVQSKRHAPVPQRTAAVPPVRLPRVPLPPPRTAPIQKAVAPVRPLAARVPPAAPTQPKLVTGINLTGGTVVRTPVPAPRPQPAAKPAARPVPVRAPRPVRPLTGHISLKIEEPAPVAVPAAAAVKPAAPAPAAPAKQNASDRPALIVPASETDTDIRRAAAAAVPSALRVVRRVNLLVNRHTPTTAVCYHKDRMLNPSPRRVHADRLIVPADKPAAAAPRLTGLLPKPHHYPLYLRLCGFMLLAIAIGGVIRPMLPTLQAETAYQATQLKLKFTKPAKPEKALPASVPKVFDPLITPDGLPIVPVDTDFGIVVPKVGINAAVIPAVDPANPKDYDDALLEGVAHASTSFYPDENGTVYLFSHSTNYEWFVKDLNAVFFLLKNLDVKDTVVLTYKGKRYTYEVTQKKIVKPSEVAYLKPVAGKRTLILQTCWPPGSTTERMLIFADLVDEAQLN
jgi:LPXTG-site transpeptidase (sortase) family protein